MEQQMVPCRHCAGTGAVPIPPHLRALFTRLTSEGRTLPELVRRVRATTTEVQNHLTALVALGIIERERRVTPEGARWFYSRSPEQRTHARRRSPTRRRGGTR
jgi:predicted transcriptional regulator